MSDAMNTKMFGELDTNEVSAELTNGTYLFELTNIKTVHKKDDNEPNDLTKGRWSLIFEWTVCDDESEFFGEDFQQWFTIYPYMTTESYDALSAKDKLQVKRATNWLKNQLTTLGMKSEDLADFNPESLKEAKVGLKAYIDIVIQKNESTGQTFKKPKKITLEENANKAENGTGDFAF